MLTQNSIVDKSFLFNSHIRNQRYSFDWMLGDQGLKECSHFGECTQDICGNLVLIAEKNREDSCPLSLPSYTPISTPTTMPARSTPLNVYHRKKLRRKPPSSGPFQGSKYTLADGFNPAVSSESLYGATNAVSVDVEMKGFQPPLKISEKRGNEGVDSKSGSCNECPNFVEHCSDGSIRSYTSRGLDHCSVDDSCSSSKLNVDIVSVSLKQEVDDTGECSSSGARAFAGICDNMSEKEILICILRDMGLLEKYHQDQASADKNCMTTETRICRSCDHSVSTRKMLICDQCEEAFHPSCCNPRIRRIPIHEWFCNSCINEKRKLLVKECPSSSTSVSSGSSSSSSNVELSHISLMLKESETYHSTVRLGSGFQAEVPTWSGPAIDEIRSLDESAQEMMESEYLNLSSQNSVRTFSFSAVGNWLQCRAVIRSAEESIDGTICGKWRRAPLFEVQTDNWECFCSILWDPSHSDCAVPQELPTDEVLKHLKYIETMRPRLAAAKKRKLGVANTIDSRDSKQE